MLKKIVLGTVITAISAGLIYGAINRTTARSENSVEDRLSRQESNGSGRRELTSSEAGNLQNGKENQNGSQVRGWQGARNTDNSPGQPDEVTGQAEVTEWIMLYGTVIEVTDDAVLVETENTELITIDGMTLRFAMEQGDILHPGATVELKGFFEGDDFEIGEITDTDTGLTVVLREDSGRPLWAGGRGRRGA